MKSRLKKKLAKRTIFKMVYQYNGEGQAMTTRPMLVRVSAKEAKKAGTNSLWDMYIGLKKRLKEVEDAENDNDNATL